MTKATKAAQAEAIETIRKIVREGDTLFTVLRGVSRGGMGRRLDVYAIVPDRKRGSRAVTRSYLTSLAATACGYRHSAADWRAERGLYVGGCGFDAGHDVAYNLSLKVFGRGDALRHEWL